MVTNRKPTGRASSVPGGLALGAGVSIAVTLILSAVIAYLVDREVLAQEKIGYGIMICLVLSAFLGAMTAGGKIKRQRLLVCAGEGALYFGILLACTAMFFGGQYDGVGVTALLIAAGALSASMVGLRGGKRKNGRKIQLPNR